MKRWDLIIHIWGPSGVEVWETFVEAPDEAHALRKFFRRTYTHGKRIRALWIVPHAGNDGNERNG